MGKWQLSLQLLSGCCIETGSRCFRPHRSTPQRPGMSLRTSDLVPLCVWVINVLQQSKIIKGYVHRFQKEIRIAINETARSLSDVFQSHSADHVIGQVECHLRTTTSTATTTSLGDMFIDLWSVFSLSCGCS